MNKTTFLKLNKKQRYWYAKATIATVWADGHIDKVERQYLNLIFELFADNPPSLQKLEALSEQKEALTLEPIAGISSDTALAILKDCVAVSIADGHFAPAEERVIQHLGKCLSCQEEDIHEMIVWGQGILAHIFKFDE